jgi:cytochrome c biogenesis protein CcmG/thiol:disulfide interchange protein DsbE
MAIIEAVKAQLIALLLLAASVAGCDRGERPRMVGEAAPVFTVQDADRRVALNELRGKVVVLNFWATWCPPCVDEMPSLVALQNRMGDKVVVLAVSVDQDKAAYDKFLRDFQITNLLTVRDEQAKSNLMYGTTRFPETFIIDANGVLQRKIVGPIDWSRPEMVDYLVKLVAAGPRAGQPAAAANLQ